MSRGIGKDCGPRQGTDPEWEFAIIAPTIQSKWPFVVVTYPLPRPSKRDLLWYEGADTLEDALLLLHIDLASYPITDVQRRALVAGYLNASAMPRV